MPGFVGRFSAFFDELDDWCGTKPHRPFPPNPGGLRDILISEVINEAAGRVSNKKISTQLQGLANELHAAGARTLAG
jgi:hypothetical protein